MDIRFKHIYQYIFQYKLRLACALALLLIAVSLASFISDKGANETLQPVLTIPATTTTTTTTISPQTTTTFPDLSGVDFVALARSIYGKCGEYHDLAIQVGWPEEEWPQLQQVIWRESRCVTDAWNGADSGLTQINHIHSEWLSQMGWSHPQDMFNPEYNLTFALRLWQSSGWKPWKYSGTTWGN